MTECLPCCTNAKQGTTQTSRVVQWIDQERQVSHWHIAIANQVIVESDAMLDLLSKVADAVFRVGEEIRLQIGKQNGKKR